MDVIYTLNVLLDSRNVVYSVDIVSIFLLHTHVLCEVYFAFVVDRKNVVILVCILIAKLVVCLYVHVFHALLS